ncbi:hypothetical protein PF005_g12342 [Phytophthora fragariae]|uniref:Uncharacterized protein n=1 Tax=Phytophthora fragariae TaxID=53985 RepID=A0A6A3TX68_9STRA|nr:hypothetical protein PF003_g36605 [Phytophthora fragariae]KAE8933509.1 hypothetical protein PF009_g16490 [Phytophthora fragariae]KAE9000315.1 hypothetical protein PF011_g14236 [Phytophthora fragariae]KAE9100378.1 hypothetical protein PF007_g15540 [Phytophthora fragariae]KAE9108725.1 hypothetical protein PF010_g11801 [Phytophthora fragariae]
MVPARHALASATAAAATLQMAWMQVHAADEPLGSGEVEVEAEVGDEPVDAEEVAGGDDALPAPDTPGLQQDPNAEALVAVATTEPPPAVVNAPAGGDGEEEAVDPNVEEPPLDLDNASANAEQDTQTPTLPTETSVPVVTELPTTEAPVEPETTQPVAIVEVTTKPFLRTQDPSVISEAVTNDAADTHAPGYLGQGINPIVFIALAGMCCILLLLWGRKRRSTGATSSGGASAGTGSKGPKVAYTQVPDEQPFSHSQDDDDEFCDDYEEDTFANDRDNWDDWEGNSSQTQAPQLNPFVAAVHSPPRPTAPRQNKNNPSPFQLSQPLPPPPQHVQLQEIAIAGKGDLLPSSVESNSSSDSFEVVTEEAHMPPTSNRSASASAEKEDESENVDDLFSQFGMVPTFKKSAVVPPPPAATTSAAPATAATQPTASLLPTAAEASALFAAEMDDELTAVDAADEWGEDDEWVKGI